MRAAVRLYSIATTEIHEARNRARSLLYAEIVYSLTLWNNSSESIVRSPYQPTLGWANGGTKCRITNLEQIPLLNDSSIARYVQKDEEIFSELM